MLLNISLANVVDIEGNQWQTRRVPVENHPWRIFCRRREQQSIIFSKPLQQIAVIRNRTAKPHPLGNPKRLRQRFQPLPFRPIPNNVELDSRPTGFSPGQNLQASIDPLAPSAARNKPAEASRLIQRRQSPFQLFLIHNVRE